MVLDQLPDRLVAEQLDGIAQGVFEVFADRGVALVGLGIQGVEQSFTTLGAEGLSVQQGDAGR
jgi:hypothetical protein